MLRRTKFTNKSRFLSRLNFVTKNGAFESAYEETENGKIYYVLEYVN